MPRIKAVTDANGVKFYPTTITKAIYDIDNSQKLDKTISDIKSGKADKATTLAGYGITDALPSSTKYAGSSSAGGAATSAAKLTNTTKIGDTNKPVYFTAEGVPAAISYTIDKSVPSDAKFTDTTYSDATTSASGLMSSEDKTKLNGIAAGAQVNSITGVKGDNESSYRTGNVNITAANIGLGNVGNFKAVSTVASQGLSSTEQANARANIGAGTSSFSGSYNDLTNKPTIPAAAANGTFSIKTKVGTADAVTAADFTANQSSADDITLVQGTNVTLTTDAANRTVTIAAADTTYSAATTSTAGLMSAADKTKLEGIATGATANTGTITKVGNTSSGAVTVSSSNNTASFGNAVTVGSVGGVDLKFTMPGNPNTDRYVNSAAFADDTTANANSPVKMTLTRAGSDTATVIGNLPKVSSSSAGVAPKGAAVSSQSQSTKFLREDGTWAAPSYTTNTTYSFSQNGNTLKVTPSGGSASNIYTPSLSHTVTVQSGLKSDGTTTISGTSGSASSPTVALGDSGATAGSYGDSTDQTPGYGSTFKVPYITVNAKGIVTGVSAHTVKIPATDNTWRPLGTGATDACAGNDSRLSNSRPASDVYSWAKAANKPSYAYSEITYSVSASSSAGGSLSLNGAVPTHVITLTGDVTALTLSANPAEGHSCHVIFTSSAARSVTIKHDSTSRICPRATDVVLSIAAGGYAEVDFLTAGSKVFVRGV